METFKDILKIVLDIKYAKYIKKRANICKNINCQHQSTFNFEDKKQSIYCSIHKLNNMIDIKHKRCAFKTCKKQPIFNFENEKTPIFCKIHKLNNMIDIKNKKCIFENCKKTLFLILKIKKLDYTVKYIN